jgi:SpoVK/Ycf46/Vps4 family AAA+-type ATPase
LEKRDFIIDDVEVKVDPQQKLNRLVGLTNVKEEVHSIISFVKMQKLRREHGLPVVPIQLHSVFTGNPGTGKTTVAKVYAELLKECGLLKRGHLIITSRADFVAGYVGQTSIKTKRKIREALGGVLFIDEAYSLLGQTSGDFGKEVIDTLVDEMTKHNENLVIVLAGYPNEMKLLLESNPGLQSRFKKFLHFADYSPIELLQIMKSYGKQFVAATLRPGRRSRGHRAGPVPPPIRSGCRGPSARRARAPRGCDTGSEPGSRPPGSAARRP